MRRLWLAAIALLLGAVLLAALKGQSYSEGVEMICSVPTRSGARDLDPGQDSTAIAVYLEIHLTNPRAQALWKDILWAEPREKQTLLEREVKRLDSGPCEILDLGS